MFLQFTYERTQANNWLWEDDHVVLQKLSQRLEHITGLSIANPELGKYIQSASESYQVRYTY
jgi:hypothetical protein